MTEPVRASYNSFCLSGIFYHRLNWWDADGAYSTETFECEAARHRKAMALKIPATQGEGE